MAPPTSRIVKNDTARPRPRHDTKFKAQDVKRKPVKILPPGLREEEDDDKDWPPKYKKAPPPPKVRKVPARHPRTGRKLWDSTQTAPLPKPDLRASPERAVDLYDSGWRNSTEGDFEVYERRMRMFYEQLKKDRDYTRKTMMRQGLLADPDKPTTLADAITIVGTCEDMCPVHERVERIVQQMVDKCEKVVSPATGEDVPYEDYMVKRFRRSAAGDDEQLPTDIRPPLVLQKTLNYLLEEVVNGPEALSKVHKFVWDRTRGIRNDFSIQQVTEPEDVRIAMDCFERIARFHILALHQLSLPENVDNSDFDAHQELEQLNKTLLSLTYYYDDNRDKVQSLNEAEFRAYIIVIEIQYPRPHLEHRASAWPKFVLEDAQVQIALNLYAACAGIGEDQGPWFADTSSELARGNPRNFFASLKSPRVPYLLACVAEIFFHHIRGLVLESIWKECKERAASPSKTADWLEDDVRHILGFDDVDQANRFCLSHGLYMTTKEGGKTILDLERGRFKKDRRRNPPQVFSKKIVEDKRAFRTYLEITDGLAPPQEGIEEALDDLEASLHEAYEPLFVSDDSDDGKMNSSPTQGASRATDQASITTAKINPTPSHSSGLTESNVLPKTSSFGKPTPFPLPMSQNRQSSTSLSRSADSKGPDDINGARSSANNLAPRAEQRRASVDFSTPSKTKPKFSAPVGKWPFPKNITDGALKNLATPTSSNPKNADRSPQISSENTTAQPGPSKYPGLIKSAPPNSFSRVSSENKPAQPGPSVFSNPFKSTSPNPFSQASSEGKPAQPGPSVFSKSFKSASPDPFSPVSFANKNNQTGASSASPSPFSQVSSQNTNSQAGAPASSNPFRSASPNLTSRPDSSKSSSGPLDQDSTDNAAARSARSAPSPYSGASFNSPGAASFPSWNTQDTAAAVTSTSTKFWPGFPTASPFSGSFNGIGMQFSNPAGVASLPTWEMLASFQRSQLQVSPAKLFPAPLAASPFSGSFNGVQFSNPHAAASLPSWATPLNTQHTPAAPLSTPALSPQAASSLGSSSKSPFDISRPLLRSNPTNTSSPLLNAPPLSSEPETAPSDVPNILSWSFQRETSPSALENAPPIRSQPGISTSALRSAPLLSRQPEESTSAKETATSSGDRPETSSSIFQNVPPTTNQTERPFSMPSVTPTSLKKPKVFTPTQMNRSSASPRQSLQSPHTTVLTMETSHVPTITLTAPVGEEDLREASKSSILIPPTPSGSIDFPSNKIAKDTTTPESSTRDNPSKSSSASPADCTPFPLVPLAQSAQQPEMDPHQSDRRSETIDAVSKAIMLDQGCLMQQFLEFHIPHIVQDCIGQVEDERSRKEAEEYRVMMLSEKYLKKWRTNAWKMGLKRRAPERRRKFAQSLQEMARDAAQRIPDFIASITSRRSENRDRQQDAEFSAESSLTPSSSSKKRKSPDVDYQYTPDRVSRNKRRRPDQDHPEHLSSSRRMKASHKRSTATENPKLSETEELINTLIATRSDYTYLANGSVSSYKIIQKIRTLLPPVKLDDTRSDYFLLKSRGIDPDTPIVPRTIRKHPSSDDIQSTSNKRIKESSLVNSASALSPPSYSPPSRSLSSSTKSSFKYRDRSAAARSIDFDETENELLAAQGKTNGKTTEVIEWYREQRAKFGSGRINTSATSPNRSIEYYKEQRAKWGTPAPSIATSLRQSTSSRTNEVFRASGGRYGVQSTGFEQDTKSAFRAAIEQRQRDLYASMQPGPENPGSSEGGTPRSSSPTAAAAPAGSSAEDAIEL